MKKEIILLPKHQNLMSVMGENIKLARKRRKITAEQLSERANISRPTLTSIEQGNPTVSMGNYFNVLNILGLQNDILNIASHDVLGRKLQDLELLYMNKSERDDLSAYKNKLMTQVFISIKRKHYGKSDLEEIIGLDYDSFENHLNNNKYGFFAGQNGIDTDHIIPVSTGTNKKEIKKLFHYTNLQLLPSLYNRDLKGIKKWCKKSFDDWFESY